MTNLECYHPNEWKKYSFNISEVNGMIDKKAAIFEAGRELFLLKGFKDINVSDITNRAGVSVGTFYSYYTSKEKLFAEIYFRENEKTKRAMIDAVNLDDDPIAIATKFMSQIMDTLNSNLVLKEWYNRDVAGNLEKTYREQENKNDYFVCSFFKELLNKWRAEGRIRSDIDDSHILALLDALIYLDTHKEEAGIGHSPRTMQLLVEFIIKGIANLQKE
jgi:Transcriptional regulator